METVERTAPRSERSQIIRYWKKSQPPTRAILARTLEVSQSASVLINGGMLTVVDNGMTVLNLPGITRVEVATAV